MHHVAIRSRKSLMRYGVVGTDIPITQRYAWRDADDTASVGHRCTLTRTASRRDFSRRAEEMWPELRSPKHP
jgi:hypothetical protein